MAVPQVVAGYAKAGAFRLYTVFAANIDNLPTAIGFFQNPNNLALRKSRLLHFALREAIFSRNLYFLMALFYGEAAIPSVEIQNLRSAHLHLIQTQNR
jgi:hypothetical protein